MKNKGIKVSHVFRLQQPLSFNPGVAPCLRWEICSPVGHRHLCFSACSGVLPCRNMTLRPTGGLESRFPQTWRFVRVHLQFRFLVFFLYLRGFFCKLKMEWVLLLTYETVSLMASKSDRVQPVWAVCICSCPSPRPFSLNCWLWMSKSVFQWDETKLGWVGKLTGQLYNTFKGKPHPSKRMEEKIRVKELQSDKPDLAIIQQTKV